MPQIQSLVALAKTPGDVDITARTLAVGQWLSDLHKSNDAHLISIYAGRDTPWDSPELEGLPLAKRWIPQVGDQGYAYLFFDSELSFMQRAGDAVERAASLVGIDPITLQRSTHGADSTVAETLINALVNEWATPRLCDLFWQDQQIKPATRAVYGISLEGDSYLVFVGPGDMGEPCVVILGEQPFESMLYPAGTPADKHSPVLPETSEVNGHTIEANDILPAAWWKDLADAHLHTLLRACFMQMAVPGMTPDILSPAKTPQWRDVPVLPIGQAPA